MDTVSIALQIIIALGIFNVWILRYSQSTQYRGGNAANLKEEFANYGLPGWAVYVIGFLKVACAVALVAGIWIPSVVQPAAGIIVLLMAGALIAHLKVRDPMTKFLPALAMLVMSLVVAILE